MARGKRKVVRVMVTLSVASHVTAAQARKELRSRVNHLAGWYEHLEEGDVRLRGAQGAGVGS